MVEDSKKPPELGSSGRDQLVAVGRGVFGVVPFAGTALNELMTQFIPDQRIERIENYLRYLHDWLSTFEKAEQERLLKQPQAADLFEDGAYQAIRALSDERIKRIAGLVAKGITGDEKDKIEAKRMLNILEQIDDDQVIILTSYLSKYANDTEWRKPHAPILDAAKAHLGSSQDEIDQDVVTHLAYADLARLGLLQDPSISAPIGGPSVNPVTRLPQTSTYKITPLGRLLLVRLGVAEEGEI